MKYRKTALVDAVQWRGGEQPGEFAADVVAGNVAYPEDGTMLINTLEGVLIARPGDWIVRGPEGEPWPVRADIFAKTYVPAESPQPKAQGDGWVSVEERMPEESQVVMLWGSDSDKVPHYGYRNEGRWVDYDGWEERPTHWRPLPAPPKVP